MTPLAYSLWKRKWSGSPQFGDRIGLFDHFYGFHCFEVSQIDPLADQLVEKWFIDLEAGVDAISDALTFLPAPRTWIERKAHYNKPKEQGGGHFREGWLLEEAEDRRSATVFEVIKGNPIAKFRIPLRDIGSANVLDIDPFRPLRDYGPPVAPFAPNDFPPENVGEAFRAYTQLAATQSVIDGYEKRMQAAHPDKELARLQALSLYAYLVMINSPRVIGRRQHPPHKVLQKGFAGGHFPLHAWTEIKLEVTKPTLIDDGEPHQARLTGLRALHFCRAHVRIKNGKLEYVTAHWRGDASIGIKRSRYAVTP
jgi:hypothetical protein